MSVQKLIAEAEKLLDKKKVPDAIERFKTALGLEPLNQLVSSRLANIYLDMGDRPSAARAYSDLAARLAEAGKTGVAIAFYKQAIEISPDNMELRVIYARECEEMGKIGDAQTQAQAALQHYLRRKKYLDASVVMPLLIRLQGRDDLKAAWIEVIQLGQGEQKIPHLLVALCGPPGMLSTEFNVGGDAATLSEGLYEGLKGLVAFFPRDPRVPYAVAWAASR
ncbi:MAG: tetratricopeptide repeat protein, partial [Proteobacteria bacterium]